MDDKKMSEFTEVPELTSQDFIPVVRVGAPNENLLIAKENLITQLNTNESARGILSISADGDVVTLDENGDGDAVQLNQSIIVQITVALAYVLGATITNSTTGATGKVTNVDGDLYTLDTLTAGTWKTADVVTNGVLPGAIAGSVTWVITMPVGKLKLAHFDSAANYYSDANNYKNVSSKGTADAYIDSCLSTLEQKLAGGLTAKMRMVQSDAICVLDKDGNGWEGYIQNVTDDDFELVLVKGSTEVGLITSIYYYILTGQDEIAS